MKRILVMLVGLAELATGGRFAFISHKRALPRARWKEANLSPALTLPRHLHVLRLLCSAEAAMRLLIIAFARGLVVTLPSPRARKPKPLSVEPLRRSFDIAVVLSVAETAKRTASARVTAARAGGRAAGPRRLSFPLVDPLRMPFRPRRDYVPVQLAPRVWTSGLAERRPVQSPPSPGDPVNAARLNLRSHHLPRRCATAAPILCASQTLGDA